MGGVALTWHLFSAPLLRELVAQRTRTVKPCPTAGHGCFLTGIWVTIWRLCAWSARRSAWGAPRAEVLMFQHVRIDQGMGRRLPLSSLTGISLIETMVALVVIVAGLSVLGQAFPRNLATERHAIERVPWQPHAWRPHPSLFWTACSRWLTALFAGKPRSSRKPTICWPCMCVWCGHGQRRRTRCDWPPM